MLNKNQKEASCELALNKAPGGYHVVKATNMVSPSALFTCRHCAEAWGNETFGGDYKVTSLFNAQFLGDFFNKISNIEIIHNADNASTTGTLYKHLTETQCKDHAYKILGSLISQWFSLANAKDVIQTAKDIIGEIELQILEEHGTRPLSGFIPS